MTKSFETLDDAILQLRDLIRNSNDGSKISPARYDRPAIHSIAEQIRTGTPFTERQQELTIKLVTKYRKQWKKNGFDVSNIDKSTPTKKPLRQDVDRRKFVDVAFGRINMRFPYQPRLIGFLAENGRRARGHLHWDKEKEVWDISITADNVYWVHQFAKDHKFDITADFKALVKKVDEAYDYDSIELDIVDRNLVLKDAPDSMLNWIHSNIGRIEMKNFVALVSAAGLLAFKLSQNVVDYVIRNHPSLFKIILQRQVHINSNDITLNELLLKIKKLEYNKIIFYDPSGQNRIWLPEALKSIMPTHRVYTKYNAGDPLPMDYSLYDDDQKTIVITNKVIAFQADVIVSLAGFMASTSRRAWFDKSPKVIYYCSDIDKKLKKIIRKDESNFNYKG